MRQTLELRPRSLTPEVVALPRSLRALRSPLVLDATNAVADLRLAIKLLADLAECLGTRIVAIVADAGGGKTQLAAQITAPHPDRPAGILFHGRNLHSGQDLNDLASRVVCQGKPVTSIESLMAAVDAAGQRAGRRLPVAIDGLNEAEDPRDWKPQLSHLDALLKKYAHVLVVCTLRSGSRRASEHNWARRASENDSARQYFADQALPAHVAQLTMEGFGEDTVHAIRRYFAVFRISAPDVELPIDLLSHPLQLRLFCEVTNGKREREVGIEAMPRSLSALFDRYVDEAATRISELSPKTRPYLAQDVRMALDEMGRRLWTERHREVNEADFRAAIDDTGRPWHDSIVRLLEQEGIILRVEGRAPGEFGLMPVYDALGGYLVANALLSKLGRDGFAAWLGDSANLRAFEGDYQELHPLSTDIFLSLAGLLPRRLNGEQLWKALHTELRRSALLAAVRLESEFLDAGTVAEIAELVRLGGDLSAVFSALRSVRSSKGHPLNAEFLDRLLRSMTNADRDLRWTEWLRQLLTHDRSVSALGVRWRRATGRSEADRLLATWTMWYLTSTSHDLRDKATRALYWFGRGDARSLFNMTSESLEILDPYVPERMLAASYGVAIDICCHGGLSSGSLEALQVFARQIYERMFKVGAAYGTTHSLMREYARRIVQLAGLKAGKFLSAAEAADVEPPYTHNGIREWQGTVEDGRSPGADSPFRMDFENYTLGRLVRGRNNYDFDHAEYKKVRAHVLWRVESLGWRPDRFKNVDQRIEESSHRARFEDEHRRIDRYGKKYSLIAYYEAAGLQHDLDPLGSDDDDDRSTDVDIDPTFPTAPSQHQLITESLLGDRSDTLREWIENGATPDMTDYVRIHALDNKPGPWIALDGYVSQEDKRRGRKLFCFLRSFIVKVSDAKRLQRALARQSMEGRWLPEKPKIHDLFAGEYPWSNRYQRVGKTRLTFVRSERKVKARRKRVVYFLDGKRIAVSQARGIGLDWLFWSEGLSLSEAERERVVARETVMEVEETQRDSVAFEVMMPVCDFSWEGPTIDGVSVGAPVLAKEIAGALRLRGVSEGLDLVASDGSTATCTVGYQTGSFGDSQRFFFLREDLLKRFLRQSNQTILFVAWGERELATHLAIRHEDRTAKYGKGFKVFSSVMSLSSLQGRVPPRGRSRNLSR